jgi:hypothetical protein
MPNQDFNYKAADAKGKALKPIAYKELLPWDSFDLARERAIKGIPRGSNYPDSLLDSVLVL